MSPLRGLVPCVSASIQVLRDSISLRIATCHGNLMRDVLAQSEHYVWISARITIAAGLLLSGCVVKINSFDKNSTNAGWSNSFNGSALYYQNQNITYSVALSDPAIVTGVPRIPISVGGVTRYANYAGGSGSSTLTFIYQPQTGDFDSSGATVNSSIDLNGGAVSSLSDSKDLTSSAKFIPPAGKVLIDAIPHTLFFDHPAYNESESENAGARAIRIGVTPASLGDLRISLKRAGTAVAGVDDDFTATEVTIPAGSTSVMSPLSRHFKLGRSPRSKPPDPTSAPIARRELYPERR